jgi:membrane protease YdiL (CAAX protease family)
MLWAFAFRGKRGNFWTRMALVTGSLGAFSLSSRPDLRRELPRRRDVLTGIGSAAALYCIFELGDRFARTVMPDGEEEIQRIYAFRGLAPKPLIALLLAVVIAPGEELFWRGLVQHALMLRFGRARGTLAAAAAYGGTHLVTGNLTLTGAASVAGTFWGTQYALEDRLVSVLICHVVWDLWIFLLAPTPTGRIQ